jgi:hypothetical protein
VGAIHDVESLMKYFFGKISTIIHGTYSEIRRIINTQQKGGQRFAGISCHRQILQFRE